MTPSRVFSGSSPCADAADRFAGLLRRAAAASPDALAQPPFVEAILIGGVRWQLAQSLVGDRAKALDDLAADLERYLLCYYLPPQLASSVAAPRDA